LLGATDDLPLPEGEGEIVASPALAAFTGDLPRGATREQVLNAARLHALALRVERRPAQAAQGGAAASAAQPRLAFSPVAVTPDEWLIGRQAPGRSKARGGELLLGGRFEAGGECASRRMVLGLEFESLLSELVGGAIRNREVRAGSVFAVPVGSAVPAGAPAASPGAASNWPLLQPGDQLRLECLDAQGASVFGAIEHTLREPQAAEAQN
jgi:fumarylacetoacetate (FAA) hydrolase